MTALVCGENGWPDGERWSARFIPLTSDRERLHALAADGLLLVNEMPGGQVRVAGRDHAGRLRLPSGLTIDVRSKVDGLSLLRWLAYTEIVPDLDEWLEDPAIAHAGSFVDVLAILYVVELARLTQFHWRPGHRDTATLAATFRGRLDVNRLGRTAGRLPALPCRQRERTMDTLANRILARALDAVWRLANLASLPPEPRRALDWLTRQWSDIARSLRDVDQALALVIGAPPVGYRRAVRLARLILRGARIDAAGGDGGEMFLVDMSRVWEEGLRRLLATWASAKGIVVAPSSERTRRWADAAVGDPYRALTPDALLLARRPIAFDAKYKRAYGDESRGDRFQITAYAMAFGAVAAFLVYPTATSESAAHRVLLRAALPGADSTIHSLELPMALGPAACAAAVAATLDDLSARWDMVAAGRSQTTA